MNHKDKLYFPDWDDDICAPIPYLKDIAKSEGVSEFDAYEAILYNLSTRKNESWNAENNFRFTKLKGQLELFK